MDGDRPITRREDDRLGFTLVAEHLARAIIALPATEGFVFGIEGKWGSGKSSLINLTIQALKSNGDASTEVITFAPWLVGDRDDLLRNLFSGLASAAVKIDPAQPASWTKAWQDKRWKSRQKRAIGCKLAAFGNIASHIGKLTKTAGSAGVPLAGMAGAVMEAGAEAAKTFETTPSISKQKAELVDDLNLLSRRIVVFVDDLDRLEPHETNEVLRLIRAVADFPNVVYVLSYDPNVVAKTLVKAIQVDDGAAFLEKIVQVSFRVPAPEAFDLRRWFEIEVRKLFFDEPSDQRTLGRRLASIIDGTGGRYLKTGRDVVRTLNALRLHGLPVRSLIDIPDMVWLQLIRIGQPDLYAWVEEYLTEAAAVANGASVSHADAGKIANRLKKILDDEGVDDERAIFELSEFVPGLSRRGRDHERVFSDLRGTALDDLIASKRLGSPQHYRYYFAFSQPAGALSDERVQLFIDTAETDPVKATQIFADLAREARPQGGTMADVLIDRLTAWADRVPEGAVPGLLKAFGEILDDLARRDTPFEFGEHRSWRSAARAVKSLLKRTSGEIRSACLEALFAKGKALGWLSNLLRDEIFSHGHYGDQPLPPEQRLLTSAEFTDALTKMLTRYRQAPVAELMAVPELLDLLFAWSQGGDADEPRRWVDAQISTDAGLLTVLSRMRTWAARNDEVYYPLRRRNLENFLDYEAALRRVDALATSPDSSKSNRKLAAELLIAFDADRPR